MPHGPVEISGAGELKRRPNISVHTQSFTAQTCFVSEVSRWRLSFKKSAMHCNHITFQQPLTARETAFGARNRFRSTQICRRQISGIVTGVSCI